jgi:hypothetical protein
MSLPSKVGLPSEVQPSLSYSLPASTRSYAVRVQPTNLSSVTSSTLSCGTSAAYLSSDLAFPNTEIRFDIPTSQSPSTFLDTRQTTINFKATVTIGTAGVGGTAADMLANQRGGGSSWFDLMQVIGGDGQVLEMCNEYGLTVDTVTQLMMNQSQRDGAALPYGFLSATTNENQGHAWNVLTGAYNIAASTESHSYSLPVMSGIIGAAADSFLNIGRVSKLQLVFQTPSVLPITIKNAATSTAVTFTVTLSDFTLGLEYCDVGMDALAMIDETLIDGQYYSHGTTYKVSSTALAATSGSVSLLSGLRGSSLKSLITRFQENALTTAGAVNGKYDSKCPNLSAFSYSIGGVRAPQSTINCLTQPALAYTETLKAVGAFNSALFNPSIIPTQYCVLSVGGVAQAYTNTNGSDYNWNTSATAATKQAGFFIGQNLEKIAKRGVFSGLDATSAPIFNELNIQNAITNAHNVFNIGLFDVVYIHDVRSGLIQARM